MADTRRRLTQDDINSIRKAAEQELVGKAIRGKRVCFTGRMSMRRQDMESLARACGARIESNTNGWARSGTAVLVVGDTGPHGVTSKMQNAIGRGWLIMSEDEFTEMLTTRD